MNDDFREARFNRDIISGSRHNNYFYYKTYCSHKTPIYEYNIM